ncbi:recombinase A [compost metagenome]
MAAPKLNAAEKAKILGKVTADINKKAGRTVIGTLQDPDIAEQAKIVFLKTPSSELNVALGGGFPLGKIVELMGENSSGKTSLAIETMAKDMAEDPDSIWGWYESEGSFDMEYAKQFPGFDESRLYIWYMEDEGAEKGLDFLEAMLRTGQFRGIVVNSVAGLTPSREMESEMGKQDIALQARMMSKLMRKITAVANRYKTLCLFINQFRTNVGQMFGDPTTTTGGKALAFYSTQRIAMRKVKLENGDGITDEEGLKISCRIGKNRVAKGNPYKAAKFTAIYGMGIDQVRGVALMAVENNLVEKSGAWIYFPSKANTIVMPNGVEAKFASMAKFIDAMRDETNSLFETLRDLVEAKASQGHIATELLDEDDIKAITKFEKHLEDEMKVDEEDEG